MHVPSTHPTLNAWHFTGEGTRQGPAGEGGSAAGWQGWVLLKLHVAKDSALEQREAALAEREAAMARASAAAEYARSEAETLWRSHKAWCLMQELLLKALSCCRTFVLMS